MKNIASIEDSCWWDNVILYAFRDWRIKFLLSFLLLVQIPSLTQAQEVSLPQILPSPLDGIHPQDDSLLDVPSLPLLEEDSQSPPLLSPLNQLPPNTDLDFPEDSPVGNFAVSNIVIEGSTIFDDEVLIEIVREVVPKENATLADLFIAAEAITEHYVREAYPTTGAAPLVQIEGTRILPVDANGTITFQVYEGSIEAIEVSGTQRLNPDYVSSRLASTMVSPTNSDDLVEALQLLHNDPLIESLQATLTTGTQDVGSNILQVTVKEADSFDVTASLNNQRSPFVGTFQRGVQLSERNLFGFGDHLSLSYNNTNGSDGFSVSYGIPINPRQGTLNFRYSQTDNDLIDDQVEVLDINSKTEYFDLSWRQPLILTPEKEFAIGVIGSVSKNKAVFGEDIFGFSTGFPSVGADENGRSQVTVIRFFQDWISRSKDDALALRSQFSLGLGDFLGGTVNADAPDNRFFSWRGQAQYRHRLGRDAFLLARGDLQLASRSLLPAEQFGLGGRGTVRGYRQDLFLTDNGALASAEVWVPVMRVPEVDGVLQLIPFIDVGLAWDNNGSSDDLAALGIGLQWQQERLSARIDWGIPLVDVSHRGDSLQENGIHFSFEISPF